MGISRRSSGASGAVVSLSPHPVRKTGPGIFQALEFLSDYKGYIQSDDFTGYDHLDRKPGIIHLGCWAHYPDSGIIWSAL
ncbi:MAG: transposase [Deltaproteobacteria bacterium]|nr:transposase [Deltaproteobacteria bacterium]